MDQEDKGHKDNDGDGSKSSSSWLAISSNGERKKIVNLWKAWKKFPCAKRLAVSRATFGFEPKLEDSTVAVINRTSTTTTDEVDKTIEEIRVLGRLVMAQESRKQSKLPTQSGLLLFFPGIPGCGKSSLLHTMETTLQQELTAQKREKEEDDALYDKKVYVKEGDKMGKNFWDVIGDLLSNDDHDHDNNDPDTNEQCPVVAALVIADKNAPPASWPRVGQTCNDSHSIPLPVLLDATVLETTTIEGLIQPDGVVVPHSSHCYPFSLKFLAVCLARVLSRPAGEHSGKLDSGSPVAGMIVVQFYSFYRYVSADTFLEKLDGKLESKARASSSSSSTTSLTPIELPFLNASTQNRELPEDLQQLLVETLQLRQGHDKNKKYKVKKDDPQMIEIEQRLRPCIELHRDMIEAMTVSVEETQHAFRQQVLDRLESLRRSSTHKNSNTIMTTMTESSTIGSIPMINDPIVKKEEESSKNDIKLVSLDIERTAVHNLLQQYHESQLLTDFFDSIISTLDTDDTNIVQERRKKDGDEENSTNRYPSPDFITDTHVTMAFAGEQNSASTLLSTFHHLQGEEVRVTVTGFLWSSTHAALAITIASSTCKNDEDIVYFPIPTCENSFPHITVWCAPDTEAYHSNNLPDLVQSGKAYRVDFEEPHRQVLVGRFCFWNHDNVVITI